MQRVSIIVFFLLCYFVAPCQRSADDIRRNLLDPSGMVMVAAHRGAHHKHPENSLGSIEEAIRLGVDIVEIDVKVSKDGVPFLMHDRTMDRTTNGKGDPEEFTWEELQRLRIVDNGKITSLKIPSLEDAMNLAKGKIMVDLDLKTDRIRDVIRVIGKTNTSDIVIFFDSDYHALSSVKEINGDFFIMPRAHSIQEADSAIALFDPPVVHIDFSFYTKECIALIRESFARTWVNALGAPDEDLRQGKEKKVLKKLLADGANIIQTDEPQLLLKVLKEKGYRKELTNL